jgi:hypothetical protein
MSGYTIQIPVLFDMSGDTLVFGEDGTTADFINSHLDFTLDMRTTVNDISLNASHFSHAIRVGDQDDTENLFYGYAHHSSTHGSAEIDLLANTIAEAITKGKLVHIPKTGNSSNTGIPMGGRSLRNADGVVDPTPNFNIYAPKYFSSIAPIGDEQKLGDAMGRIACVHLVGHPLSASIFVDDNSIQNYLETPTDNTFEACLVAGAPVTFNFYNQISEQLSKVLGGSLSPTPVSASGYTGEAVLDASGTSLPALKSVLEQLLTIPGRAKHMIESRDISGERDPNDPHKDVSGQTHTGPFPILPGDKLVMFIRPKIEFSADTVAQFQSTLQGWQVPGTPLVTPYAFAAGTVHTNGVNRNQTYNDSGHYSAGSNFLGKNAWGDGGSGGQTHWRTEFNGFVSLNPGYLEDGTYNTAGANDQTTPTTLGPYRGEWTQVRMPEKYAITKIIIKPIYHNPTTNTTKINPTHFALLGTNDDPANGNDWNIIKTWTGINSTNTWYYNNQDTNLTVNFDGTLHHYKYWRFIINKRQISDLSMNTGIESINMYGVKQTEIAGEYVDQQPSAEGVDISGLITNVVSQSTKVFNAFPGKDHPGADAEENKWCWMGSGVSDSLTRETTDELNSSTIDLHVWKITISL